MGGGNSLIYNSLQRQKFLISTVFSRVSGGGESPGTPFCKGKTRH